MLAARYALKCHHLDHPDLTRMPATPEHSEVCHQQVLPSPPQIEVLVNVIHTTMVEETVGCCQDFVNSQKTCRRIFFMSSSSSHSLTRLLIKSVEKRL